MKRHINPTPTTSTMHDPDVSSSSAASSHRFKPPQPPLFIPPGHVLFRLICHTSRVGGIIGKSGCIVKQLQQLTNSKIRIEDPTEGIDHQVISVVSSPVITNRVRLSDVAPKDGNETNGGINIIVGEWFDISAAQEGMLRVFERVVEVAAEGDALSEYRGVVSCRLLVTKYHGGAIIGKGGSVVDKIRKDTGCSIMLCNAEKFFPDSFAVDEIVEIEGNILAVKKALIAVTSRLQEFPHIGRTKKPLETESMPIPSGDKLIVQPMPSSCINHASSRGTTLSESEKILNKDNRTPLQEVVFKILCPNEKVGGIIGKGGFIVKDINNKTGASISIEPIVADCDERVITITAMESVESQYSPAQKAAILVFDRSMELDSKGPFVLAQVLVPSNQVGCLLGKGGVLISEIRKGTGTSLWFIRGNQVPKCVSENVEVLQIKGEMANVQNALFTVTGRLRNYTFSMLMPNRRGNFKSLRTEDNVCGRLNDLSLGFSDNLNEDKPLTQSMHRLRISNNIDLPTSPNLIASQKVSGSNQGNVLMNNVGRSTSINGGVVIGSGNRSAIVTNTTIEIVVPDTVIGSIYGDNGNNLALLRQISGANVMVHEPHPVTNRRIVVISGTPDETQAAQRLLEFVLSFPIKDKQL